MTVAYVKEIGQNSKNSAGTTLVVTLSATAASGNFIVMRAVGDGGVAVSSIADSRSNTWAVDISHASGPKTNICSTLQNGGALQSGDTVTITYSGSTTQAAAILDEFSGVATSTPKDKTATGTASTTSRSAGTTATLTQANELVVAAYSLGATEASFTHGTGYSDFTTKFLNATGTSIEGQYQVVSATTALNPTATGGTSIASNGVTCTYKAAAAAGITPEIYPLTAREFAA